MGFPVDPLGAALVFGVGGYLAATTTAFIVRALSAPKEPPLRHSLHEPQSEPVAVAAAVVRLIKWPLLGVALVALACANQTAVIAAVPALFASYGASVASAMPLFASTKQQAFLVGRAYEALRRAAAGAASTATSDEIKPEAASLLTDDVVAPILALVSDAVGRNVSVAELLDAPRDMALQDAQRSAGDRVLGALSLVNIAWIVSILLIAGLAIPCLYALATPFRERLMQLWRRVIWPAIVALEPAYEPLAYIGVAGVAVESLRYPCGRHDVAGSMVALTAVALFAAAMGYTSHRHGRRNATTAIDRMDAPPSSQKVLEQVWRGIVALSIGAVAAPLAVAHGSTLLGYLAVSATLVACGFTAVGYPLCLFIGFREKKEAYRVAGMCLLMTLSNAALRALGASNALTAPFESAVSVVGTAVYFLALSIVSVLDGGFGVLVYAGNLVGYVVLGSALAMPGMVNAALAWGSVEAFILTGYRVRNKGVNVLVVFAFTAACSLYAASLYVSTHPEVLAAMLTGR